MLLLFPVLIAFRFPQSGAGARPCWPLGRMGRVWLDAACPIMGGFLSCPHEELRLGFHPCLGRYEGGNRAVCPGTKQTRGEPEALGND